MPGQHWTEKRVEQRLKIAYDNKLPSVALETADLRAILMRLQELKDELAEAKEKPRKRRKKLN